MKKNGSTLRNAARYFAALTLSSFAFFSAQAAEKQTVAILEATVTKIDPDLAHLLTEVLASEIHGLGRYKVMSARDVQAMIGIEKEKQLLGCTDVSCIAEIGGALGAEYIVASDVGKVGETYVINVRLISTQKISVDSRVYETVKGEQDALISKIAHIAKRLFAEAGGGEAAPAPVKAAEGAEGEKEIRKAVERPGHWLSTAGSIAFWCGVGSIGLGGVSASMSIRAGSDYKKGDLDALDNSRTWAGVMWTSAGAGLSLLAAGVTMWAITPEKEAGATKAGLNVLPVSIPSGFALAAGGQW